MRCRAAAPAANDKAGKQRAPGDHGGSEPAEAGAGEDVPSEGSQRIHLFQELCGETCFLPGVEKQEELRGFSEHSFVFLIKWLWEPYAKVS